MQMVIGPRFFDKENASNNKLITLMTSDNQLVVQTSFPTDITWGAFQPLSKYLMDVNKVIVGHTSLANLDFFKYLPNVESVDIMTSLLGDVEGLQNLSKLRELFLQRPSYSLNILGKITTLVSIFIGKWRASAKSVFKLKQLNKASIHYYDRHDMQDLSHWQLLKQAWFNRGKLITLEGIPQDIVELRLTGLKNLQSVKSLSVCHHLEDLRLARCGKIYSLEGIENCYKLRILAVDKSGVLESLWPLQKLKELEFVLFGGDTQHDVDDGSIEVLYSLPNLKRLIISKKTGLNADKVLETSPKCQVILTK